MYSGGLFASVIDVSCVYLLLGIYKVPVWFLPSGSRLSLHGGIRVFYFERNIIGVTQSPRARFFRNFLDLWPIGWISYRAFQQALGKP